MNTLFMKVSKEIDKEIKEIHKDKIKERIMSNNSNSLPRIINKYQDMVSKLSYYDTNNKKETLFNIKLQDDEMNLQEIKYVENKIQTIQSKPLMDKVDKAKYKEHEFLKSRQITPQNRKSTIKKSIESFKNQAKRMSKSVISTGGTRMENSNIEFILGNSLKKKQESLFSLNEIIELGYNEYSKLKIQLDELSLELEVLENYEKFAAERDKSIISKITNNKTLKKHEKEKIIQEKLILFRQTAQKEYLLREEQLKTKRTEIDEIISKIDKIKYQITKKEEEKAKTKSILDQLKEDLIIHYHKLLYEAIDVRKDGLTWIIQEIWSIGEKVQISYMPRFLDEQSVSFLFKYTENNLKYYRQKRKFEQYQIAVRNNFNKSLIAKRQTADYVFKRPNEITSLQKEDEGEYIMKMWLKTLKPSQGINELEKIDYNHLKSFLELKDERIGIEESSFFNIQKEMEISLNDLKSDMDNLVKFEIDRIFKEFIFFDYERRFNIKLERVIKALVGDDKCNYYLNLYKIEKTKIKNNIKKVRLFNPVNNKEKTKYDKKKQKKDEEDFVFLDDGGY